MTADRRLRIGAWAALLAACLGLPTIFIVSLLLKSGEAIVGVAIAIAQSSALLVAVVGLRELVDQLPPPIARAAFACGVVGYAGNIAWFALLSRSGSGALTVIIAVVVRVLIGLWLIGSAVAVGRGNGRPAAVAGASAGIGAIAVIVAAATGVFGVSGARVVIGLSEIVGVLEVIFLVLLWRFVLVALAPDSSPA